MSHDSFRQRNGLMLSSRHEGGMVDVVMLELERNWFSGPDAAGGHKNKVSPRTLILSRAVVVLHGRLRPRHGRRHSFSGVFSDIPRSQAGQLATPASAAFDASPTSSIPSSTSSLYLNTDPCTRGNRDLILADDSPTIQPPVKKPKPVISTLVTVNDTNSSC